MKIKPLDSCKDTPCTACPMRRESIPGWLGASTPEEFIEAIHSDSMMPCHLTVDYEDPAWEVQLVTGQARACAGVAIYFANISKRSRDSERRRLPADKKNVFASPTEFLTHHKK